MKSPQLLALATICSLLVSSARSEAVIGTNLGGWMVLEPWITPSLFYQFMDKDNHTEVALDSWTFCEVKGPEEGNRWMRAHWDTFYNKSRIEKLAQSGVKRLRVPIGDWIINQYGPYAGCMDGAAEKIDWLFDLCADLGIDILLDVHAVRGSANGQNSGGREHLVVWKTEQNYTKILKPDWLCDWNYTLVKCNHVDYIHFQWSLQQAEAILQRWGWRTNFLGYEPVNEPAATTNLPVLFDFYREVRKLVQKYSPHGYFVFHDAFQFNEMWNDLFADNDHDKVALDHHKYAAYASDRSMNTSSQVCDFFESDMAMADKIKYEVWMGEWSLATDVCAQWLMGFNGQNSAWQFPCNASKCPEPYLDKSFDCSYDKSKRYHSPYGDGNQDQAGLHYDYCWFDSALFSDKQINEVAQCVRGSLNKHMNSSFFWSARAEFEAEKRWHYQLAFDEGWLNWTSPADGTQAQAEGEEEEVLFQY